MRPFVVVLGPAAASSAQEDEFRGIGARGGPIAAGTKGGRPAAATERHRSRTCLASGYDAVGLRRHTGFEGLPGEVQSVMGGALWRSLSSTIGPGVRQFP